MGAFLFNIFSINTCPYYAQHCIVYSSSSLSNIFVVGFVSYFFTRPYLLHYCFLVSTRLVVVNVTNFGSVCQLFSVHGLGG